MKKRRKAQLKKAIASMEAGLLSMINLDAAGIDLGSETHWVAVPSDRDEKPIRSFGCFTADLHEMAGWLKECGIKSIAMESTGVYWIPVFQVLESSGFEVKLVNARHIKNVPGRKTDVLDCQWLQRLHSYGLLSGSFRPEDKICVLRSYLRHRDTLVKHASTHIHHMQKALIQMNLHLHKVLSDITGVTGMRMIRAIVDGERNPSVLASMRGRGVKKTEGEIMKALQGDYRKEHVFALRQAIELYDVYHQKIEACDIEIEKILKQFDSRVSADSPAQTKVRRKQKPRKNQSHIDLRGYLYRITGVDFTLIPGLEALSVQTIISEVGLNPSAFPSEKHFTSWLGLCPNNRITGGKIMKSSTRKVVNRATNAFRLAAQALANSHSALGAYYRRMRSRLGPSKANTATAHKLARMFYRLWKSGGTYVEPGLDYYEKKYKERVITNMKKKAKALGFNIVIEPLEQNATGQLCSA